MSAEIIQFVPKCVPRKSRAELILAVMEKLGVIGAEAPSEHIDQMVDARIRAHSGATYAAPDGDCA